MAILLISLGVYILAIIVSGSKEFKNDFSMFRISDLWTWTGNIGRHPYLFCGLLLFNVKHNLDRYVYHSLYGSNGDWQIFNYLYPFIHIGQREITPTDIRFFAIMFLIAIPFIYTGVGLTLKRLRALDLPLWLALLFFVPILNFLFFLVLSILPSREQKARFSSASKNKIKLLLDKIIPDSSLGSAIAAILVGAMLAFLGVLIEVSVFKVYGFSLFATGPFSLGLTAALVHGYHGAKSLRSCLAVALLSTVILSIILVLFAVEGFICVLMALPIELIMVLFGAFVGYFIQDRPDSRNDAVTTMTLLMLVMPALMGAEYAFQPQPTDLVVKSYVDVDAPVDVVWKNVVAFPVLPEPEDYLFKMGVAYPTHAEINGTGVGAVRECHFSTGAFVEPITAWEENRLLTFDVVSQPAPMKELSPYDIHPPHLDNYLMSKRGQFLLTKLPNGKIRLEGTTWYSNRMWPDSYWRIWSDHIIHQIHLRVLEHIKNISEDS